MNEEVKTSTYDWDNIMTQLKLPKKQKSRVKRAKRPAGGDKEEINVVKVQKLMPKIISKEPEAKEM
jgi:hypothetical protein